MRKIIFVTLLPFVYGCSLAVYQAEEEETGVAVSAARTRNQLEVNGLYPNGLYPNGLYPNGLTNKALTVATINPTELSALQDPGDAGVLSRGFMKYAVSCAFESTQSISIVWNGGASHATFQGALGLAPEWMTEPLSPTKQRWVSACIAARVNFYAVSVAISMRSEANSLLAADDDEKDVFSFQEGAFFGNLFDASHKVYSCYHAENRIYSREKLRDCAAGHVAGGSTTWCGILESVGDCSSVCSRASDDKMGYASCTPPGQSTALEVISTFLD